MKVLLAGDIDGQWDLLLNRLDALQNSSQGPFDLTFIVGGCFSSSEDLTLQIQRLSTLKFPLPTYCVQYISFPDNKNPENFHCLATSGSGIGISTIKNLTVAFCDTSRSSSTSQGLEDISSACNGPKYRGCDFFLSSDWPRDFSQFLSEAELSEFRNTGLSTVIGQSLVSKLARQVMPRYHLAAGHSIFYQRPPYRNGSNHPITRFLGLGKVNESKDKSKKWLHALSIDPIILMHSLGDEPANLTENPYVEVNSRVDENAHQVAKRQRLLSSNSTSSLASSSISSSTTGPAAAVAAGRAALPGFTAASSASSSSSKSFFFQQPSSAPSISVNLQPPSSDAVVLFIGGIKRDMADIDILSAFPGSVSLKKQPEKSYAFLTFRSHQDALTIVQNYGSQGITVKGRMLSVGWASGHPTSAAAAAAAAAASTSGMETSRNHHSSSSSSSHGHSKPNSHQLDCWFCLSSPSIKAHLIVSVSQHAYLALPRGGIAPFHVLVIPIDCISNRLLLPNETKVDFDRYDGALTSFYQSQQCYPLKIERAIRTKGKDHMQQHYVPIAQSYLAKAVTIFLAIAQQFDLDFHELKDNQTLEDYVHDMDVDMDEQGSTLGSIQYFYLSIPTSTSGLCHRYIYIHRSQQQFPMFLGSEIAARILEAPDRANWKNCLLSESEEQVLAENFRAAFEPYDFSLMDDDSA